MVSALLVDMILVWHYMVIGIFGASCTGQWLILDFHGEWLLKLLCFGSLYLVPVGCVADGWEKFGILIFSA